MDHSNVLSVPEEYLKPGSTAKGIERQLHSDSRIHWSRRGRVDKIIIMDWKSEKFPEPRDESPLAVLKVRTPFLSLIHRLTSYDGEKFITGCSFKMGHRL